MMPIHKRVLVLCQLLSPVMAALATSAYAQWVWDPKMQPMLPTYCRNAQVYREHVPGGNNPKEIEYWNNAMGASNFLHMHHYCQAIEHIHRAQFQRSTVPERNWQLHRSLVEFDYVLERVKPDFVLLPEILTKKGESLARLDRAPEAVRAFMQAINLKPEYWPPYAALSDLYRDTGQIAEARAWLEKGLAAAPTATALQSRLRELSRSATR